MKDPVVIVGGGQAAVQLCLALRKEKYQGGIIVLSDEAELPYHRPPLSKSYITGQTDDEKLLMRPASFYESRNIDLRLNSAVIGIDPTKKLVTTESGSQPFAKLALVMGARARKIPLPGIDSTGVFELRDIDDARNIKEHLTSCKQVVIVGAGFIGLEAAAALNAQGYKVVVFDTADRVMGRAVAPEISAWFQKEHASAGIEINLNSSISEITANADGAVSSVISSSGRTITADMVLVGVGVEAHTELAETAGIACNNGIIVDEFCTTSHPDIYAAGDCANHPNVYAAGQQIRLESVQNATDQARTIASCIAAEGEPAREPQPYQAVPWFWSDQAAHSLQMTGLPIDADTRLTRGDPSQGSFSVFHFRGDTLLAVDSVNAARDHMLARKLLAAQKSPTHAQAQDSKFSLKELL